MRLPKDLLCQVRMCEGAAAAQGVKDEMTGELVGETEAERHSQQQQNAAGLRGIRHHFCPRLSALGWNIPIILIGPDTPNRSNSKVLDYLSLNLEFGSLSKVERPTKLSPLLLLPLLLLLLLLRFTVSVEISVRRAAASCK